MIRQNIFRHLRNIASWRTRRKIIVFESDDWGSIRMPSRDAFEKLKKHGLDLTSGDSGRFNTYDTLAKSEDLELLFEVLCSIRDKNGNNAKFTALSVVANPDFNKIRESEFSQYFFEPFTDTLKRYYGDNSSFLLWKEGINLGIFVPQFHGREHLNVPVWLRNLRNRDEETLLAFDYGLWSFNRQTALPRIPKYQAAFDMADVADLDFHASVISEGLELFESLFGYRAKYFVPPNGSINNTLNEISAKAGIKFRSASRIQLEPLGNGEYRRVLHYLGQKNNNSQTYLIRNSIFEPSRNSKDWVDSCLNDIKTAFAWHNPAVIGTHRVNYIGGIDISNRDRGLRELSALLMAIIRKWPEVEFMTSEQLGSAIISGSSNA